MTFAEVLAVYEGSDGAATQELYRKLSLCGPRGAIALNLFRAYKNSSRAKVYRGGNEKGRYRDQAYERKAWAIRNLCNVLTDHAADYELVWGWGTDPAQEYHSFVLYVDTPHGQVSFHHVKAEQGPQYPGKWDGARRVGAQRICQWCSDLLSGGARDNL